MKEDTTQESQAQAAVRKILSTRTRMVESRDRVEAVVLVGGERIEARRYGAEAAGRLRELNAAYEPLLLAAYEAGRAAVLGDLSAPAPDPGDTLPCPVCPGPTEHEGELCDDCAAYVGAAPEVGR